MARTMEGRMEVVLKQHASLASAVAVETPYHDQSECPRKPSVKAS